LEIADVAVLLTPLLGMLVMLFVGIPIGISIGFAAFIGFAMLVGVDAAMNRLAQVAYQQVMSYALSPLVVFIFMGEIIVFTGIGVDLYQAIAKWSGRIPGSLAMGSIVVCAIFGAICGVSMAGALAIGLLAIPEMQRMGYHNSIATGAVAAGGTLSIMIPPSIAFVFYGIAAEESIGALFIAGIIPGVIMTLLYGAYIFLYGTMYPERTPLATSASWRERLFSLKALLPVGALFVIVLGSIYFGLCTPSEAGAMGASGALLLAMVYKKFSFRNIITACRTTALTVGMVLVIFVGAIYFGFFMGLSGLTDKLVVTMVSLPVSPIVIIIIITLVLMVLGCFLDIGSLIFLTTPVLLPVIKNLGFDPVWYGVVLVITCEMAMITPPVGMNLFVIQGIVPEVPIGDIIKGAFPFFLIDIVALVIIIAFPSLATWLPSQVIGLV